MLWSLPCRSWNDFLRGTSALFGGRELCDCYRREYILGVTPRPPEKEKFENRFFITADGATAGGSVGRASGLRAPAAWAAALPLTLHARCFPAHLPSPRSLPLHVHYSATHCARPFRLPATPHGPDAVRARHLQPDCRLGV